MMNYNNLHLFLIVSFFLATGIQATGQTPEKVIYQTDTFSIKSNPLNKYEDRIYKDSNYIKVNSDLQSYWKGYIPTFEIIDNKFYLRHIFYIDNSEGNLNFIFKNKITENGIFIKHSEIFYLPLSKNSLDSLNIFKERKIVLRNGIIKKEEIIENPNSRIHYLLKDSLTKYVIQNLDSSLLVNCKTEKFIYYITSTKTR